MKEETNMEKYEAPKMEVVEFDNEDIITTSCPLNDCPGPDGIPSNNGGIIP